mgnify:CR=1 FL=1
MENAAVLKAMANARDIAVKGGKGDDGSDGEDEDEEDARRIKLVVVGDGAVGKIVGPFMLVSKEWAIFMEESICQSII